MSEFSVPDGVPTDWVRPREDVSEGFKVKEYKDGVDGIYDMVGYTETRFPDGSFHLERNFEGRPLFFEVEYTETLN